MRKNMNVNSTEIVSDNVKMLILSSNNFFHEESPNILDFY